LERRGGHSDFEESGPKQELFSKKEQRGRKGRERKREPELPDASAYGH
jgi:hypothetical protein